MLGMEIIMSDINNEVMNELSTEDFSVGNVSIGTGNLLMDVAVVTAGVVAGNVVCWFGKKIGGLLFNGAKKAAGNIKEKAEEKKAAKEAEKAEENKQPEAEVVDSATEQPVTQ
jgi:hypothetical protein